MKKILLILFVALSDTSRADDLLRLAQISIDDAAKKVLEADRQRVLGARTERIDGKKVYVIKSLSPDGRVRQHKFDAQTGDRLGHRRKK